MLKPTDLKNQVIKGWGGNNPTETMIVYNGQIGYLSDWADLKGVSNNTLSRWLRRWDLDTCMKRERYYGKGCRGKLPDQAPEDMVNKFLYGKPVQSQPA